ncbi:MAG: hypothetical protein HeimC3_10940 [Candidatus Heimdallarchaeota archaeon LC_3]|nr:MAG: hypothetical protein HeimC3_10940 [Candidatus Heimdallarchaeota archaeon LC_3]
MTGLLAQFILPDLFTDYLPTIISLSPSPDYVILSHVLNLLISSIYGIIFGIFFYWLVVQDSNNKLFKLGKLNIIYFSFFGLIYGFFLFIIGGITFLFLWPSLFNTISSDIFQGVFISLNHMIFGLLTCIIVVFYQK